MIIDYLPIAICMCLPIVNGLEKYRKRNKVTKKAYALNKEVS